MKVGTPNAISMKVRMMCSGKLSVNLFLVLIFFLSCRVIIRMRSLIRLVVK